jgi:hypothetical protein
MRLRVKAGIITAVLSAGLLWTGFGIGKYWLSDEMENIKILTSQATEKVLLLTRQNQLLQEKLEQSLQEPPLGEKMSRSAWLWPHGQGYMGLLGLGQTLLLNSDLHLKLQRIDAQANLAVFQLHTHDSPRELELIPGAALPVNHAWRLGLRYLQSNWAVVVLEPR